MFLRVFQNVFTKEDCDQFLSSVEAYVPAAMYYAREINGETMRVDEVIDLTYRRHGRAILHQPWLAEQIIETLRPNLPQTLIHDDCTFTLSRINPTMQYLRYRSGEYFKRHIDKHIVLAESDEISLLTVQIYLSDNQNQGATAFYRTNECDTPFRIIYPQKGNVVVFAPDIPHEGKTFVSDVDGEVKLTLRTDILYRKQTE